MKGSAKLTLSKVHMKGSAKLQHEVSHRRNARLCLQTQGSARGLKAVFERIVVCGLERKRLKVCDLQRTPPT